MTFARVTAHDGVGTSSAAFGGTPTSGNLLLAFVGDTATGATITGWTKIAETASVGGQVDYLFAKTSAGTEGTITPSGSFILLTSVCEFSGARNPFAQDGTAGTTTSGSNSVSLASAAITTTDANSLIILVGNVAAGVTGLAWSGGPTLFLTNSGNGEKGVMGQYIPGSTQTAFTSTLSWTQSTNPSYVIIAAFKPPVVAAGPANVKTVGGLAKASVKTVGGLAIASVKTIEGLA